MSIPLPNNNISKLNEEAINTFIQSPTKSILIIGKDNNGREYLEVRSKGLWTWIATNIFRLSSYQLDSVSSYVKNHNSDLGIYSLTNQKNGSSFYKILNGKIRRYNKHHPNSYVLTIKKKTEEISTPLFKDQKGDISTPLANKTAVSPFTPLGDISKPLGDTSKSGMTHKSNVTTPKSNPEIIKETKAGLVNFYVNQRARLEDLKGQLATAKEQDKHKIQQAITKIECSDIARAKIALKVRSGKEPTVQELATYLRKSSASVQGFLLGQAYAQAIFNNTSSIITTLSSLDAKQFGEYADIIKQLKQLKSADLDGLAKGLNTTKANAVDSLIMLWSMAQELPNVDKQDIQKLTKTIEEEVTKTLNTNEQEVEKWLSDIHVEKELAVELNRLGEERKATYPDSFSKAAEETFEKHGVGAFTTGMWTFFVKGQVPSPVKNVKEAEQQWKLFLNPKHENFQSTLDRALRALNQMPYINGKIVASDTIKRKSDTAVVDDPCEPKLLFYFNGPNGAEDFKKAIELLEKEFMDADLIGAPAGQRDKGNGKEEQWGPSFTKERNRLMFYTQGGFTESGRDTAILNGTLADQFEGDNFYLHKGFHDPLADLPSPTYSMDSFLDQMNSNVHLFNQPLQLIKLQNMLNRLNQDAHPSPQVQQWKGKIQSLMTTIASNMHIQRQSSLMQLLDHWENMGDVNNAAAKIFHRELNKNVQELDSSKGTIEAKLNYLNTKAQKQIDHLQGLLKTNLSTVSWEDAAQAIPLSFQEIFFNAAISDQKKLKESLIKEIGQALKTHAQKSSIKLSSNDLSTILTQLQDDSYTLGQHNGELVLIRKFHTLWGKSIEQPAELADIVRTAFSYPIPSHIQPFCNALEKLEKDQRLVAINPNGSEVNLKAAMELALKKLQNVKERQEKRLEAYKAGEAVVIPHYYHATDEGAAASIAKTGIEAVQASSGFGAFLSTEPEFRYGYVAFGLPKNIEFGSEAKTIFDQQKAPHILSKETQVWAGLDHLIGINPRQAALEQNFASAIRQATLTITSQMKNISNEERMEIEERLIQAFNRSVVFRAETGVDGKHVGWSLNYRNLDWSGKPAGTVASVKNDENLNKWAKELIESAMDKITPSPKEKDQIINQFLKGFPSTFKKNYYHGKKEEANYVMPGQATEKVKACLIAPDDEFKDMYEKEYKAKVKGGAKELRTLSEMEAQFKKAGIGSDLIEFVPLSEQLIERDFLMEVDATVPSQWK